MKKLIVMFAAFALAMASAAEKTYHVTINEPASINGTQVKPGDYKVQLEGDKAIFKMGKTSFEAPAKVENADHKYDSTQVQIDRVNNQPRISEIHLGGTNRRVVFSGATAAGQ